MKFHKQNGYSHNPKSLLNTFKSNKPRKIARYCPYCAEPDCQSSCEPVTFWQVSKPIIAWLIAVALVCVAINAAMNWRFPEPTKPVATGVRG